VPYDTTTPCFLRVAIIGRLEGVNGLYLNPKLPKDVILVIEVGISWMLLRLKSNIFNDKRSHKQFEIDLFYYNWQKRELRI